MVPTGVDEMRMRSSCLNRVVVGGGGAKRKVRKQKASRSSSKRQLKSDPDLGSIEDNVLVFQLRRAANKMSWFVQKASHNDDEDTSEERHWLQNKKKTTHRS